jgi:hypothetical protein
MRFTTLVRAARTRLARRFACAAALALLLPIQAQAQCTTENLARTGIASASSTFFGYSPARTNDGDRNTSLGGSFSWSNARETSTTPALPASLDITLGTAAPVDRIVLYSTLGWEIRDYDLQYFNGSQWLTLEQVRGNTQTVRTHSFAQVNLSRVRVIGRSGPNIQTVHVRINELEICRAAAASTTLIGVVWQFGTFQPLANVRVDLGNGLFTLTDGNGRYQFNNLPAGTYTIRGSRAGWTFGSPQFQNDQLTVQATGTTLFRNFFGYDRNPIVYATGWTDNYARFNPVRGTLENAGYFAQEAQIQTSLSFTPPFATNALRVRTGIDRALYTTGQPRAILFGHSMGGLVSRAYVESGLYRNDVSQVFTFGSPHRGIPNLVTLACVANQPAVCQMSKPGMLLFNITHGQRPGVAYHAIGGNAPLWRQQQICFRIFGRRICIGSIPVPDLTFRNFGGWLAGVAIPGGDDALAQTISSSGMPGVLDRFVTQEVHITPQLGHRDYYAWNGNNLSQQAYNQCVQPVLVARSRANCGGVSFQPIFIPFKQPGGGFRFGTLASTAAASDQFEQRSRTDRATGVAGQRIERSVEVDGSPTVFAAKWSAGFARVTLIDPSGQVFDPEFAASILDGEPLPGEPVSDKLDPNMVLFESAKEGASYQFPAPRPGTWRMIVEADASTPADAVLETSVAFASDLGIRFSNDFPFLLAGERAELRLTPTSAIFSGFGEARILRQDGEVDAVRLFRQADGSLTGSYDVPNALGIAEVEWFVSGISATGQPFERGGSDSVQIGRRSLVVTKVGVESVVQSPTDPTRYLALDVPVDIEAEFTGEAMVAADLVDGAGQVVANAAQSLRVVAGSNRVLLRFAGEDIFANRLSGPYRLTNLITLDQRGADLLSDWLLDQLTTAAYDYRQFGPPVPLACGKGNLLRGGVASASSTYYEYDAARTIDGDRSTALGPAYSWSNARETDTVPALPATLQIAPTMPITAEQVIVRSTADWEIRDYDLDYFDGLSWTTIERVRGNTQTVREHRFPATRIEALRIVGRSGPDHQVVHVRVNEVEAYRCLALQPVAQASTALQSKPVRQAAARAQPANPRHPQLRR